MQKRGLISPALNNGEPIASSGGDPEKDVPLPGVVEVGRKAEGGYVDVVNNQDKYKNTTYVTEKGHGMVVMYPKTGWNKETKKWDGLQPKYQMYDQKNPQATATPMNRDQFLRHLKGGRKIPGSSKMLKYYKQEDNPNLVMTGGRNKGSSDLDLM